MILGVIQCKCNCSNIMLMHIHGNDASDKGSLESCYCEIILHVFPGNHKVRACLRVRVSVSIWQGARFKKNNNKNKNGKVPRSGLNPCYRSPSPSSYWVGGSSRRLKISFRSSHPNLERMTMSWWVCEFFSEAMYHIQINLFIQSCKLLIWTTWSIFKRCSEGGDAKDKYSCYTTLFPTHYLSYGMLQIMLCCVGIFYHRIWW